MTKIHDWKLNGDFTDSVGGLTLTPVGSPPTVGGGTGYSFNGTSQSATNAAYTRPTGSRTWILWMKATAATYTSLRFMCNHSVGGASSDTLSTNSTQGLNLRIGTRRATTAGAYTFDTTNKTFIAAVFNGVTTVGYVGTDGGSLTTIADSGAVTETATARISIAGTGAASYVNCEMYRVIEFDSALTVTEINNWFAAGSEGDGDTATGLVLNTPGNYQTYQRNGSNLADIAISGLYGGTPTSIEASFNGGSYQTIVASPAGGTFSGTLTNQAAGQGTLTVRYTNDTAINASKTFVSIGDVFLVAGQSNAAGRFDNPQVYSHGSLKATVFDELDVWRELIDPSESGSINGSVWPKLATYLMAQTGYPVAFITTAEGGTGLTAVDPDWSAGGLQYNNCLQQVTDSGVNAVKAILWYQGERDAAQGATQSDYQTALSLMLDNMQAAKSQLAGVKLVAACIGSYSPGATDENVNAIRSAIINRWDNDADILAGPTAHDQDFVDGLHWTTNTEATTLTNRWWRTILYHYFAGSEVPRGPKAVSASRIGTVITVTFTGGQGSLANAGDKEGWIVTNDGANAPITSTAANGTNKVNITLTSTPTGTVLVNYCSGSLGGAATLRDSGTYPLPPEPIVAMPTSYGTLNATLAPATLAATGTLVGAAITATANVTLGAATLAATGSLVSGASGAVNVTLGAATLAATGTLVATAISGSLSITLGEATLVASESPLTFAVKTGTVYGPSAVAIVS
jgi:hypothetical protein